MSGHQLYTKVDQAGALKQFAVLATEERKRQERATNKRERFQAHVDGINAMRMTAEKERDEWRRKAEALEAQGTGHNAGEWPAKFATERATRLALGRVLEKMVADHHAAVERITRERDQLRAELAALKSAP